MTTATITNQVSVVGSGMAAQPLDEVAPPFIHEQAELIGWVTPDSALPAGRHGPGSRVVGVLPNRWMALAKCKTMEPALFFPHDRVCVRLAQQICAICPVKRACLAYALENRLNHGVWGGSIHVAQNASLT